ncbi:hypothetical protein [Nocardia xishanensis]|uniref:hypothetical protein n=1 Tax=Nocardia xishanensis TaxID=238964 RepID=UPI003445DA15
MQVLGHTEGVLAALESAHAVGHLLEMADRGELPEDSVVVLCLSARGDKDLGVAADRLGLAQPLISSEVFMAPGEGPRATPAHEDEPS